MGRFEMDTPEMYVERVKRASRRTQFRRKRNRFIARLLARIMAEEGRKKSSPTEVEG